MCGNAFVFSAFSAPPPRLRGELLFLWRFRVSSGSLPIFKWEPHSFDDPASVRGPEEERLAAFRLVRDAIVPMAAYAAVTNKIKVGSGVINNWTRNIGLLAATFLTLDDLAPDRIICGIGAWWDPLARNVGIDRKKTFGSYARDNYSPAKAS